MNPWTRTRTALAAFVSLLLLASAASGQTEYHLQPYVAHPVSLPQDAEYVLPDGSIYIAGNDLVDALLPRINALFAEKHPGFKFKMDLISSGVAIAGVASGKSAFGPTARDVTPAEKQSIAARYGYEVTDVLVGYDNNPDVDHYPPYGKNPPGVWVNAKNPIPALSLEQLTSILTTGSPKGDIRRWSEIKFHEAPVGNNGADYAKREIHIYIPLLHGLPVVSTTRLLLSKDNAWSSHVEYLPSLEDVMNAVANDPFGIGLAGWFPTDEGWDRISELGSKVRLLPLQVTADSHVSHGGAGDRYPLAGGIHFLINRDPSKPMEPWIREYMTLLLSKEGQAIVASLTPTDGFLPLDPDQIPIELAKLK